MSRPAPASGLLSGGEHSSAPPRVRLKPDPRELEEVGGRKEEEEGRMPAMSQRRSARRASEMGVAELAWERLEPFETSWLADPLAFRGLRRAQVMSPEKQSSSSQEPL